MTHWSTPPDETAVLALAEAALAAMPARFADHLRGLSIRVEEVADDETLRSLGIEHPWDLTGLYQGVPLTQRSHGDTGHLPDVIILYREPILVEWVETGEDLPHLVASVLIHEAAHHFGWSDAEIEKVELEMEG